MNSAQRLMFVSSPSAPRVEFESFPIPVPAAGQVLVRNSHSQVSAGSETNFLRFGPQSYGLPDSALRANIGYMTVGRIAAIGAGVTGFAVGDRVTTTAAHANYAVIDVTPTAAIDANAIWAPPRRPRFSRPAPRKTYASIFAGHGFKSPFLP